MRRLAVIVAVVGLAGCVTPSIPIPPPDPSAMTVQLSAVDGTAVMQYPPTNAYEGGTAYVFNRAKGVGVIQQCAPDGSIGPTLAFPAAAGDNVILSVEVGSETVSTCVVLREGTQDPTSYCQ